MSAKFRLVRAGLLIVTSSFAGPSAADPKCQTNVEAIQLTEGVTACAVWGKGTYVVVHKTNIMTSSDRIHWTARDSGSVSRLYGVTFGGDRFVAVGNEGLILSSLDGRRWNIENSATDDRLRGVAFGKGRFVVVGYLGTIVTSRDGHRWVRRDSGTETRLQGVAYGDGRFVAGGWKGTVLTSANGMEWTRRELGISQNLLRVAYSNGAFWAADRLCVEAPTSWIPIQLERVPMAISRR